MHKTNHALVKGYIDNFKIYNNEYHFIGWCFHEKYNTTEIRLKFLNESIESFLYNINTIREDVSEFYNNPDINNCGWNFILQNKDNNIIDDFEIQMMFDNNWYTIFEIKNPNNIIVYPRKDIPSFVVIENFYENPNKVRLFALNQKFLDHPKYHKGKRTETTFLFKGLKERFENILGVKIKNWADNNVNGCFQYCIGGDQIVYHHDQQQYAGILFLTPDAPPQSGTTFYRSKYTKNMKTNDMNHDITFKNGYLDSTCFEVVDVVGNIYNRLVLFDAHLIHSASTYFGNNLDNGRLFQLFFFDLDI